MSGLQAVAPAQVNQASAFWMTHRPWLVPVLLLWGWQTDVLMLALIMGVMLEAPRFLQPRIDIAQDDFNRLWSFSTVLLLGVIFYLFLARQGFASFTALVANNDSTAQHEGAQRISSTALTFLRWLPFTLFPFIVAHAWSRALILPWSTFSLYEQARAKRQPTAPTPEWAITPMSPGYLYLAVVLFASTTSADHTTTFAPLLLIAMTWVLWPWRNRSYGIIAWLLLLSLLMSVAILSRYSRDVASKAWEIIDDRLSSAGGITGGPASRNPDQEHRRTALGHVGVIQQSGAIFLRVQTSDGQAPGLLRDASFNRYRNGMWDLQHQGFTPLDPQWLTTPPIPPGRRQLTVSCYTTEGDVPLAIPEDLQSISSWPVASIETNDMAAFKLRGGPPLIRYTVICGAENRLDQQPQAEDTNLRMMDPDERETIVRLVTELGLPGQPPEKAAVILERWFSANFTYSRWQEQRPSGQGPLTYFLRTSHAGHCEFYATATALLLRAAGIPTRYATGFSTQEQRGDQWLARGRDAHAWCLAWINGAWVVIDNTPGTWRANESAASASSWEGISDTFSNWWFHFAAWRQDGGGGRIVVLIVGLMILAWIGWRQLRGSRWRRTSTVADGAKELSIPGLDSEFFSLLDQLAQRYQSRPVHETPQAWIRRLALPLATPGLLEAVALHQRLRFDPTGIGTEERQRLRLLVTELVTELRASPELKPVNPPT